LSAIVPEETTIALVDQTEHAAADAICEELATHGYQIERLDTAADLLPQLHDRQPDVLLLALANPAEDGLPLCEQVKHDDSLGFLPVIMLLPTRDAQPNPLHDFGADEVLIHPVDPANLIDRLRSLIRIKQRFDVLSADNRQLTSDIAERNAQLEAALKTARELDVIKTALVRNVSHELRTPLLQVKSAIALLDEEVRADIPNGGPFLIRLLNMAIPAIGRLESTVANITQLAESQNLKLEPVALNESIDLAIRNLERSWKSQDNYKRITKRYDKDIPLAYGDKRGIAQIAQHLLDNALKFSPDGGPVDIFITATAETVTLAIQDHGIGIPPEEQERVFDSFYQIDSSSTRQFGGVGVGLTLVRLILDQMQGRITLTSQPGKGSTFSVTFLRYQGEDDASDAPADIPPED
jgi:signal transduction histidine kinase